MIPNEPHLLIVTLFYKLLPYWVGLASMTNRMLQKWQSMTTEVRSWKALWLLPWCLRSLFLGKASNCVMSILEQPFEVYMEKNGASHQQLGPTCKPCEWTNFKVDFSAPVKLSDQCSLSWHLTTSWRELPSQNCPAKLPLNYWMTEIVR